MANRRKKRQRILIKTPYPKPEETAKMFGLSKKQRDQVRRIVDEVMGKTKSKKKPKRH